MGARMCMQLQLVTKATTDLKQSREGHIGKFGEKKGRRK